MRKKENVEMLAVQQAQYVVVPRRVNDVLDNLLLIDVDIDVYVNIIEQACSLSREQALNYINRYYSAAE